MEIPLQISFHGLDHSDAVEERVRKKIKRLETLFDKIVSCRVVITVHHRNTDSAHHKGEPFHIRVTLIVPGDELVVNRDPKEIHEHEDIGKALRDAFDTVERQLQEYVARHRRSEVRPQASL
ncbi:MAG: HPF/RaiA family ribosome-associated protein [Alphaproteobacteria bacterium]